MKIRILFFSMALLFSIGSFAQEKNQAIKKRHQAIYLEALGSVVAGFGLGYERYAFLTTATKLSGRVGLGLVESFTQLSPSIGGSAMFGGKANFELGFNFLINPDISDESGPTSEQMATAFQLLIGFRYQDWDDGFMFRIFLVPPVGAFEPDYLYIPYGGITFGFAF